MSLRFSSVLVFTGSLLLHFCVAADVLFEDAAKLFAAHSYAEAEIVLKNSVQADPQYIPARLLLAKTYIALEKLDAAEKEVRFAAANGADRDTTAMLNATIFYRLGKLQQAQAHLAQLSQSGRTPETRLLQGQIALALKDYAEVSASLSPLLAYEQLADDARLTLANSYYQQSLFQQAIDVLQPQIQATTDIGAIILMAELMRKLANDQQAESFYQQAAAIDAHHLGYLYSIATYYLQRNEPERALEYTLTLIQHHPKNPVAKLLHATVIKTAGNSKDALRILADLENDLSMYSTSQRAEKPTLMLLGMVAFLSDDWQKAQRYYRQYLSAYGDEATVLSTLAKTEIHLGFYQEAEIYTERLIALGNTTLTDYLLRIQAQKLNANLSAAVETAETALIQYASSRQLRQVYAQLLVLTGQRQEAIAEIQKTLPDFGTERAKGLLSIGYLLLQDKALDAAFDIARELLENYANKVESFQFAGEVALARSDQNSAKLYFNQALVLAPSYSPSRLSLAAIALNQGEFDKAEAHYQAILTQQPNNDRVLQLSALLDIKHADYAAAQRKLQIAVDTNPDSFAAKKSLAEVLFLTKQFGPAFEIVEALGQGYFLHPDVLYLRAQLEIATGNKDTALKTLSKLAGLTYQQLPWQLKIAHRYLDISAFTEFDNVVKRLTNLAASASDIAFLQARLALLRGEHDLVSKQVSQITDPKLSIAAMEVLAYSALATQRWQTALSLLYQVQEQLPSAKHLMMMVDIHLGLGETTKAIQLLSKWLDSHRNDVYASGQLAQLFHQRGQTRQAIEVIEQFPKLDTQPSLLNNLAVLYQDIDLHQGLVYANMALEQAPNDANVHDTLGWLLVLNGELTQGLGHLREALSRDNDNPEFHLHLAQTLFQLNRKDEALKALEQVEKWDKEQVYQQQSAELKVQLRRN